MIKELIIVNMAGIALFYQNFEKKDVENYQSIAAFFTALNSFAKESVKDDLNMIQMGTDIFYFYSDQNLNCIIKCALKTVDEKRINELAKRIINQFKNKFSDEIENFEGAITIFDTFTEDLDDICQVKIKTKEKSSKILQNFLGLDKQIDYKKVLDGL